MCSVLMLHSSIFFIIYLKVICENYFSIELTCNRKNLFVDGFYHQLHSLS